MRKFFTLFLMIFVYHVQGQILVSEQKDSITYIRSATGLRAGSCSSPDGSGVADYQITTSTDPGCFSTTTSFGGGQNVSATLCYSFTAPTTPGVGMDFGTFFVHTCGSGNLTWTNFTLYTSPGCTLVVNPAPLDVIDAGTFTPGGSYVACFTMTKLSGGGCNMSTFCPYYTLIIPAPIKISHLGVRSLAGFNTINWTTASEINNQYQIVEKSSDGITGWTEVDRVTGSRASDGERSYSVIDKSPMALTYYRIHSIDFDGREDYSDVVYARLKSSFANHIIDQLVPNPATDHLNILYSLNEDSDVTTKIVDVTGKSYFSTTNSILAGNNSLSVDVSEWPNGIYIVKMENGAKREYKKFLKK